jgi:endonuclease YncB( thermonuclease family)
MGPYWKAEEQAKKAGRGMWVLGDKYVNPREWRKTHGNSAGLIEEVKRER